MDLNILAVPVGAGGINGPEPMHVLIVSEVGPLIEGLVRALVRDTTLRSSVCIDPDNALAAAVAAQPDIVLLDANFAEARRLADQLLDVVSAETKIAVFAMAEAAEKIVEIIALLEGIVSDEEFCSIDISADLLNRLGQTTINRNYNEALSVLTLREAQIAQLIGAGLTNKEIARRLNIGVATTKTHVHNLLKKLNVQRRIQVSRLMRANRSGASPVRFPLEEST
jgi:DNA-binding NarL/FixJ family response regulator